jgi:hypothetical protein
LLGSHLVDSSGLALRRTLPVFAKNWYAFGSFLPWFWPKKLSARGKGQNGRIEFADGEHVDFLKEIGFPRVLPTVRIKT